MDKFNLIVGFYVVLLVGLLTLLLSILLDLALWALLMFFVLGSGYFVLGPGFVDWSRIKYKLRLFAYRHL